MKKGLLLIASLVYFVNAYAVNAEFVGTYRCEGFDPYLNKKYSGAVVVLQQNTVYRVEMTYDTGEAYHATGGQYDPTLMSVVFQNDENLKQVGLEQYKLSDDKQTMSGYWVYLGGEKLGREVCQRVKDKK